MDFNGQLPETMIGNRNILKVVHNLSKMLRFIPLPDNFDAILIAKKFIEHVLL